MEKDNLKFNWPLVGNEHIVEFLEKSIKKDKVGGAYIFNGPADLGKSTLAKYFAGCLLFARRGGKKNLELCGDFHLVEKQTDKKNISIVQIREFISALSMTSFSGRKVGIIRGAESLNNEAANALLKTLEEPRKNVIIILLVNDLELLPSTIVSRCQVLFFRPVKSELIYDFLLKEKGASRGEAKFYSEICLGRPALAAKFLDDVDFYENYRKTTDVFLNFTKKDINERFMAIEDLIGKKAVGQTAAGETKKILDIWLLSAREALLGKFNYNIKEDSKADDYFKNTDIYGLLNVIKEIYKAQDYLSANVNPKLALENIAVSF